MNDPGGRLPARAHGGSSTNGSQAVLARHVAEAIAQHRDQSALIRLIAAELPPRERGAWRVMADSLDTRDLRRGTAAAAATPECWTPLFASAGGDPRLPARLLQTAARPRQMAEARWLLVAYPLAIAALGLWLLGGLSATVFTGFEALFLAYGQELPLATKTALALRFWGPLPVGVGFGLIMLAWWLAVRRSAGSSVATASFTRTLARLIAAEIPTDEAISLAGRVVAAPALDLANPRPPLGYAAAAALDFTPRTAAILLDAIANCHDDRGRGSLNLSQWFVGPVLLGLVGLLVGFIAVALFLPLLSLVGALS